IGLVCCRWRGCALGDPQLWSTIHIDCFLKSAEQTVECYPLMALETQILRSKGASLDVTFIPGGFVNPPPHIFRLFEALVRESHRWRQGDFKWDMDAETLSVFAGIRGRLQLLRRLSLYSPPMPPEMNDIFGIAPQLRQVSLTDAEDAPKLRMPWAQITHFKGNFSAATCVEILCRTEVLVECTLRTPYDFNAALSATPIAFLPQLRRPAVSHNKILNFLDTPNLEYLFLKFYRHRRRGAGWSPIAPVFPFFQRSRCQLKGLTVDDCLLADILPMLRVIPTLLHLNATFADEVWNSTARFQDLTNIDICPRLESIHFGFRMACDYESLYDLIVARRHTLKFAAIWASTKGKELYSAPPDTKGNLLTLNSEGLEVLFDDAADFDRPFADVTKDMDRSLM
ncbi:hypothetical protein B0H16DRAFT_1763694, partial [Mycena metata]